MALSLVLLLCSIALAAPAASPLRFDWPDVAEADVIASGSFGGYTSKAAYRLYAARGGDGDYLIEFREAHLLEVDGETVDQEDPDPRLQAMLAVLPALRVDGTGVVTDILGFDRLLARMTAALPVEDPARGQLLDMFSSPELRQLLADRVTDDWEAWVGAWVGVEVAPGQTVEFTTETEAYGQLIPTSVRIEHLGVEGDDAKLVRLRLRSRMSGPELVKALRGALEAMSQTFGTPADEAERVQSAAKSTEIELLTDPDTLLPHYSLIEDRMHLEMQGEEPIEQRERREIEFRWRGLFYEESRPGTR